MSYSYSVCKCCECIRMDLSDRCSYNNNKAWCSAWGRYEDINGNACSRYFEYDESKKSSSGGCYLTTIICNLLGKKDKTGPLQIFRNFRDEYMLEHPETYPMLLEYDMIGPSIVHALLNDPLQMTIARSLYTNYILPIEEDILFKNYKVAISKYQKMTQALKELYQIDTTITKKIDVNIKTLGKART